MQQFLDDMDACPEGREFACACGSLEKTWEELCNRHPFGDAPLDLMEEWLPHLAGYALPPRTVVATFLWAYAQRGRKATDKMPPGLPDPDGSSVKNLLTDLQRFVDTGELPLTGSSRIRAARTEYLRVLDHCLPGHAALRALFYAYDYMFAWDWRGTASGCCPSYAGALALVYILDVCSPNTHEVFREKMRCTNPFIGDERKKEI